MRNKQRLSGWWVGALMGAVFVLSTSASLARSLFYYSGGGYGPNYYWQSAPTQVPAQMPTASPGQSPWQQPDYREYHAAYAPPMVPNYSSGGASDYLASVCKEGTYTWPADKLPIKIWISDGTGNPGYKPVFQSYVRNGFDTWCAASGNKLSWVEVADANQADVTVRWTTSVTERPEGTEAGRTSALTKYNTATGKGIIYGARMQFLTQLPYRSFGDQEVEKTCLHEAGHALGLQGHSPYRNDIMYFAVGPSQRPMLTDRDRNTLAKLYANYPTVDAVVMRSKTPTAANMSTSLPGNASPQ